MTSVSWAFRLCDALLLEVDGSAFVVLKCENMGAAFRGKIKHLGETDEVVETDWIMEFVELGDWSWWVDDWDLLGDCFLLFGVRCLLRMCLLAESSDNKGICSPSHNKQTNHFLEHTEQDTVIKLLIDGWT